MPGVLNNRSVELKSDNLILKRPAIDLADNLLRYLNKNKDHFLPWVPLPEDRFYTLEIQKKKLEEQIILQNEGRSFKFYISYSDDPDRIIGDISISNIIMGSFRACHLGYKTDIDECGKGVTTKAVNSVINYAFSELELHRIEANVMPINTASQRVLEKCGFESEGIAKKYLKINGSWEDHIRYFLINPHA